MAQTNSTARQFCNCFLLHKYCWRTVSCICASVRYWSNDICTI